MQLEEKISSISTKKLRDYIINIASGATPSMKESEKYYTQKENGIPFIRVQNLSSSNELKTDNLKYINEETYEKYLRRSQVKENDLLIKITGVGRMAVSSVAPKNFIGNTNQHLVVIRTKDRLTSETLATFLNTDIGEKLASRRSTGGTRPALDYSALKSIPIVFKPEIVEIIKKANQQKQEKEAEAKRLLDSIDNYLLEKLGIELPKETISKKIFYTSLKAIQGKRFDPFYHRTEFEELENSIASSKYEFVKLKNIARKFRTGTTPSEKLKPYSLGKKEIVFLRNSDLLPFEIRLSKVKFIKKEFEKLHTFSEYNEIIICIAGSIGMNAVNNSKEQIAINQNITSIKLDNKVANSYFVSSYLNSKIGIMFSKRSCSVATILYLNNENLKNLPIPLPPLEIQDEIANYISDLRSRAKELEREAKDILKSAKKEVEKMILGK